MKRSAIIALLLALILIISGCSNVSNGDTTGESIDNSTEKQTEGQTEEPTTEPTEEIIELAAAPVVTAKAKLAEGIVVLTGTCSKNCEYIKVTGETVTETKIYPDYNENAAYFIGQVPMSAEGEISVVECRGDKEISEVLTTDAAPGKKGNLMEGGEYSPVFCLNSRAHYWSAVVAYSDEDAISDKDIETAKTKISKNVESLKSVNPDAEIIYLIAPSSCEIYPETVPSQYTKAESNSVFERFKEAAEESGAVVIYPDEIMKAHKNDGEGYKIYQNTDSHWSTYGCYWALTALQDYVSEKFPDAKARSVEEMGFYTYEMAGGDSLFEFQPQYGLEKGNSTSDDTPVTKIRELTTLYTKEMPTSATSEEYKGNKSVYIRQEAIGGKGKNITNETGEGLPSAVVICDSFGNIMFDMLNDRYSFVRWESPAAYKYPTNDISNYKPDYLIYVVSERNLKKLMYENPNMPLE